MIKNNDTLPFKEEIEIVDGDTHHLSACWTFEKLNGQVINQRDQNCLPHGHWIIKDSIGNYRTGDYKNGRANGLWKHFDKTGKLLREVDKVSISRDTYTVREVDYSSGQAVTIIDKPFLSFYLKNLIAIAAVFFLSFFSRVFINSRIYNIENGTNFSPIYFHFGPLVTKNFGHSLLCTFTFWFSYYKPQNRQLVIITNTLSVIAFGLFFGAIIGLAIEGDL